MQEWTHLDSPVYLLFGCSQVGFRLSFSGPRPLIRSLVKLCHCVLIGADSFRMSKRLFDSLLLRVGETYRILTAVARTTQNK